LLKIFGPSQKTLRPAWLVTQAGYGPDL